MASDAPLLPSRTNDTPLPAATRTPASPAAVHTTARRKRTARTSALTDAPSSSSATMACTATAPPLNTVDQNDLPDGSVTYRFTAVPRPNWITSSTAAPLQLPRRAGHRQVGPAQVRPRARRERPRARGRRGGGRVG